LHELWGGRDRGRWLKVKSGSDMQARCERRGVGTEAQGIENEEGEGRGFGVTNVDEANQRRAREDEKNAS